MNTKTWTTVAYTVLAVFILYFAGILIAHLNGFDYKMIRSSDGIGIPSYDDRYKLVLTMDLSGQYNLFSVIQLHPDDSYGPKTVFVADDFWYHARYVSDYNWVRGTYDFYVESSDTGPHYYAYSDGTWKAGKGKTGGE